MSSRTFRLINDCAEGAALIIDGVIVYTVGPSNPALATSLVAAVVVVKEAVVRICSIFEKKSE